MSFRFSDTTITRLAMMLKAATDTIRSMMTVIIVFSSLIARKYAACSIVQSLPAAVPIAPSKRRCLLRRRHGIDVEHADSCAGGRACQGQHILERGESECRVMVSEPDLELTVHLERPDARRQFATRPAAKQQHAQAIAEFRLQLGSEHAPQCDASAAGRETSIPIPRPLLSRVACRRHGRRDQFREARRLRAPRRLKASPALRRMALRWRHPARCVPARQVSAAPRHPRARARSHGQPAKGAGCAAPLRSRS